MNYPYDFEVSSLIFKRLIDSLNEEEKQRLEELIAANDDLKEIIQFFEDPQNIYERVAYLKDIKLEIAKQEVLKKYRVKKRKPYINAFKYAATLAIFFLIGFYFFPTNRAAYQNRIVPYEGIGYKNDVLPGEVQANLILSTGEELKLGTGNSEWKEKDGSALIEKNGKLIYYPEKLVISSTVLYNVLAVPEAGVYQIILPDGTRVWVNANSTIRYPVNFIGNQRLVELQGEAYFEVAHDPSKPFIVKANDNVITALGTSFNINSYASSITVSTLFTGKASISSSGKNRIINSGEILINSGGKTEVRFANLEKQLAWKNGYFYFQEEDIKEVMNQLSRWYGISIRFEENSSNQKIGGTISRNVKLSEVLEMLKEVSNLSFQIDGKDVYIYRN